ncbi:putative 3-demethylubiquinone-9 3-methyltransferase (glyoxalase superfamily) [Inquilinus ginsengisoli]|uniref:3-demethylubiquinone-9 3-methyltransferase (Glyoxalase superfamily) n=1 Tax=Inquilinus ginsengisoli TaxID=363840 RepID=A0ABU1JYA1_9PROT|nr:putative 3-demethylubiquinone-9 3-methyltransferase (glyoxalase superfamily) [Inquilinus ginsengisoli]
MQRITPFLWFEGQAEEAAEFYVRLTPGFREWSLFCHCPA